MKNLITYETELSKLHSYKDWMKFLEGATTATDKMLGFGFHGATLAAEAEGKTADFSKIKVLGRKVSDKQIENVIKFYESTELYAKLQEKYPSLPKDLPSNSSNYTQIPGANDIEKAENFEEVQKAYIKSIIAGKEPKINTTDVNTKGMSSAKSDAIRQKLITESNQTALHRTQITEDYNIEAPSSFIRSYFKDKKIAKESMPNATPTKKVAKNQSANSGHKYKKFEWNFAGSELPLCKEAELRDYFESLGLDRRTNQEVNYAGLAGLDSGVLSQLYSVVDAWKESRSSIMKSAHPDTGGSMEAIQVLNVVNSIMKDVIAAKSENDRERKRREAEKEFRAKLFDEATAAVKAGDVGSTFEYNTVLQEGECNE